MIGWIGVKIYTLQHSVDIYNCIIKKFKAHQCSIKTPTEALNLMRYVWLWKQPMQRVHCAET